MKFWPLVCGACLWTLTAFAAPQDSVRVMNLLKGASSLPADQNIILYFAKGFQGTPYAGGTLEAFPSERLVVRTDSVDCTTFVEYVMALVLAGRSELPSYETFKRSLQQIRYRRGEIDGYVSRLHYFSDWIGDNEAKGLVKEVTALSPHEFREVNLDFMSTHVQSYPMLASDAEALADLKEVEKRWVNFRMPYIPKNRLGECRNVLQVADGDILVMVTNIKGLDVVHVGFACWIDGKLHLLHASSGKKKVILDPVPLVDYSRNIRSHIGIRVVRML